MWAFTKKLAVALTAAWLSLTLLIGGPITLGDLSEPLAQRRYGDVAFGIAQLAMQVVLLILCVRYLFDARGRPGKERLKEEG